MRRRAYGVVSDEIRRLQSSGGLWIVEEVWSHRFRWVGMAMRSKRQKSRLPNICLGCGWRPHPPSQPQQPREPVLGQPQSCRPPNPPHGKLVELCLWCVF
ncbi:unnamed protein product [Discosporangium mesarthrocarpum]